MKRIIVKTSPYRWQIATQIFRHLNEDGTTIKDEVYELEPLKYNTWVDASEGRPIKTRKGAIAEDVRP